MSVFVILVTGSRTGGQIREGRIGGKLGRGRTCGRLITFSKTSEAD